MLRKKQEILPLPTQRVPSERHHFVKSHQDTKKCKKSYSTPHPVGVLYGVLEPSANPKGSFGRASLWVGRSHKDAKKNNFFINGLTKMKLTLESLCVFVSCAKGIPLGVAKFLDCA